jgi:hypothetical protein
MSRICVVIANQPTMGREGLCQLLARADDLEIAAEAAEGTFNDSGRGGFVT